MKKMSRLVEEYGQMMAEEAAKEKAVVDLNSAAAFFFGDTYAFLFIPPTADHTGSCTIRSAPEAPDGSRIP